VGISLSSSNNNTLSKNNAYGNRYYGIRLSDSSNNNLTSNTLSNNYKYNETGYGVYLFNSNNNTLIGNTLRCNNANNNTNNGIYLWSSSNNKIYNNIFNNTYNVLFYGSNSNTWNTTEQSGTNIIGGPYLGGNFWANPNGTGFSQTCVDVDRDGICDSPYVIDANITDFLPLAPYQPNPENKNPDQPAVLNQLKSDEKTQINVGEIADRLKVVFSANVNDPDGDKVRLQVELRRLDEYGGNFDETKGGLKESGFVASGSTVTTYAIDLIDGSYHWRARTIDEHGNKSEWVSFGGNPDSSADFIVRGFRFVQLSDTHIGPDPECYKDNILNFYSSRSICLSNSKSASVRSFKILKDNILKLDPKPDFVLITGDLVEWNQIEQYELLIQWLNKFGDITVYTVPGNHDRRGGENPITLLDTVFPQNNLVNYFDFLANNDKTNEIFDRNGYRFIGLDSGYDPSLEDIVLNLGLKQAPTGSGLSQQQIDIIKNNAIYDKTFVFMHHPAMDYDNSLNVISENREQFVNLVKEKNVKSVLTGHSHYSKFFKTTGPTRFIQTRSATKDTYDDGGILVSLRGYLIVDVGKDITDINKIQLQDVQMSGAESETVTTITIFSPADLHVYDEFGRHTGLNVSGGIETNIPDTYYLKESKMGNITLPASVLLYNNTLNYSFKIVSNFSKENVTGEQSSFNFTIEQRTGDTIKTINYNNISISRNTIAYLKLNRSQANYAMQVDLNNDSIMDATKAPDTIITDHAPTVAILSPNNGSTRDQGQPITFNGRGIDIEDGILTKLTWISDRDDVIGHGNFTTSNLSAGIHQITLRVNDTAGQVNTSNIVLTVIDTKAPVIDIEYPPINKIFNKKDINVKGIASDDSGISNVTVNGIQAGKEDWNTVVTLNEGENRIEVVATDNKGFTTTANRTVYYNSSLASDIQPPAAITNLTDRTGYDSLNGAWINWTWDNPKDQDFSYAIVYLDNIPMGNTSRSYFNFTGLSSDADYNVSILTADIVDNINYSEVKDTSRTPLPDTAPPQSIGNPGLQVAGPTYLNFTWTNPPDPDFSHVMLYLNGSFKTISLATQNYYNFTGLEPDTMYELGTHTADTSGNINSTWKNATASTLSSFDSNPPVITFIPPTDSNNTILTIRNWTFINVSISESGSAWLEWNDVNESMSGAGTGWYINKTDLRNGIYTYRVRANDSAGNVNVSETRVIEIMTSPLKGDLNGNGISADAGDLVLMKRASIGEIQADSRYDLNNNRQNADAGDLVLMKRASIGEITLS
jgi:parallel beta-helix repeat protein